jgi:hypothetical protein
MDDKARADALHAENITLHADNDRLHDEFACLLANSRDEEPDLSEETLYLKEMLLELRKQVYAKPSAIAFKSRTILTNTHLVSRNDWLPLLPCSKSQFLCILTDTDVEFRTANFW